MPKSLKRKSVSRDFAKTTENKKTFLTAFGIVGCNITEACRRANVGKTTVYYWIENDPSFAQAIADEQDKLIDLAETELLKFILSPKLTREKLEAIKFFLESKGKSRGYGSELEPIKELIVRFHDGRVKKSAKVAGKSTQGNQKS